MGAVARLSAPEVEVAPGTRVSLELLVRNTGTVVDQFTVDVLGPAAAWARAEPPAVSLFPQAEETVTIVFAPPRLSSTTPGADAFRRAGRVSGGPHW
jgi:hypothetical protein